MHIYYAFGNHIYSFPSMTSYVFPVWQIFLSPHLRHLVLKLYVLVNLYKILMPMKCYVTDRNVLHLEAIFVPSHYDLYIFLL